MIILKIAGGTLIIGATTLMGFLLARSEFIRESELLEMKKALTIFKNEIRFALTPFGEAAVSVSERVNSPICAIFAAAGEEALRKSGGGADEIWQNAVENSVAGSRLSNEDTQALKSLGKSLGCLDKQMQSEAVDLVIEYIDSTVAAIREHYPSRSKMCRSLGFLSGVLLTVVLL